MKKSIILALLIFSSLKGYALLPPFYESRAEYQALLESKELEQSLGSGQVIKKIKRTSKGFTIFTPKYLLQVDVIYEPTEKIGPAQFHLKFYQPQLRKREGI